MNAIKMVMDREKLRSIDMAERLKISKGYCSMLLNGDRPVSKSLAIRLRDQFGVPFEVSLCPEVHGSNT